MPDKSQLSIDSKLPDTSRRGVRGGALFEQILMSEDSIEEWRNFAPGYISPKPASFKRSSDQKDDFSEDDSMNDRVSSRVENPLLDYIVKKPTLRADRNPEAAVFEEK